MNDASDICGAIGVIGVSALFVSVLTTGAGGGDDGSSPAAPVTASGERDASGRASRGEGDAGPSIRFRDATAVSGIEMTTTSGSTPSRRILEVKGGGLVLADVDDDGRVDLFVPNGATLEDPERGPGGRLFLNEGGLRFRDATAERGIAHRRWSFGGAAGDLDGDGLEDLYIGCFGPNVVLRQREDGTFEDVSAATGLDDPAWTTSVALADLDLDGDLDVYSVNYLEFDPTAPPADARFKGMPVLAGPRGFTPAADRVFENLGDGTFRDRTAEAGFAVEAGFGLNLAVADFSGDGRPDVYVGNDSQPNRLFVQEGPWRFVERGLASGVAVNFEGTSQATMGIALGDVDGNGLPDLFTTNFSSDTNTLHLDLDGRVFDDRTAAYGLGVPSRSSLGWAAGLFDFDHDGDEDLLVVNGHVYPQATVEGMDSSYRQRPQLFERVGDRFELRGDAGPWAMEPRVDRTAVFADLDGDGDIDVAIGELNGPVRIIENLAEPDADRWLRVRLRDRRPGVANRDGRGSIVEWRRGGQVQRRWIWSGGPFQSNTVQEAHFGFEASPEPIEILVRWPDGREQRETSVQPGQVLEIERLD
ncbi:MAG: CRTAC1 family protein [Phycisphaerales bacterium]